MFVRCLFKVKILILLAFQNNSTAFKVIPNKRAVNPPKAYSRNMHACAYINLLFLSGLGFGLEHILLISKIQE